jgi:hypothetical protein
MPINNRELTADVARWLNEIIGKDRTLPFSRARSGQRPETSPERGGLTLLGGVGQVLVTGEIRLPCQKDGTSPYSAAVVNDARAKALRASSRFFFTWNVNEFVLWETIPAGTWKDQNYKSWDVARVRRESDLERPAEIDALKKWLAVFLDDLTNILQGTDFIGKKSLDEKFIDSVQSALKMPVLTTLDELESRYGKARSKSELDAWMRSDRGWIIHDDPEGIRDNLERAARFACYGLLIKLVFHEALLRRYGAQIDKISVPGYIDTGESLRAHLGGYFADAVRVAGDCETVFGEDHTAAGKRIPFYSDIAVPYWRALIGQIHEFDFSKLDCEVIGNIFERLNNPEERQKFGQFCMRAESADLIYGFCIGAGDEKVLDPAGAGEFSEPAGEKEEDVLARENKAKRCSRAKPEEIAAQIHEEIKSCCPQVLRRYDPDFIDKQEPFDTFELPAEGEPESYKDLFTKGVIFKKGNRRTAMIETRNQAQDGLIIEVAQAGIRGFVRFPREESECNRVLQLFSSFIEERRRVVRELIEDRTADLKIREGVRPVIMQLIFNRKFRPHRGLGQGVPSGPATAGDADRRYFEKGGIDLNTGTGRSDPLFYTVSHFKEISRRNLFDENNKIAHESDRCAVCNPGIAGTDPFPVYLEVIVESVLVRRPKLDEALVSEINGDRTMVGLTTKVTVRDLLEGNPDAIESWAAWVREALATGLGLLSIHSPSSLDFTLDEQESMGHGPLIESKVRYIMDQQKKMAG